MDMNYGIIGRLFWLTIAVPLSCAAPNQEKEQDLASTSQEVVQWGVPVTPFSGPSGSETTMVVTQFGGTYRKVAAFNYVDPSVVYGPTSRTINGPASMMGWSYSTGPNTGDSFVTPKRVAPISGWPVLWGDPGLAQISGTGYVFMTSVAAPAFKVNYPVTGGLSSILGGACIARSTDGGQNFSLAANDCVHTSAYDFYDGSAVTTTTSSGPVAAAFVNVNTSNIDVWVAPNPTASLSQVSNPFPGKIMADHPRLLGTSTGFYVLAADANNSLWLNYYEPQTGWYSGTAWPKLVASDYSSSDVNLGGSVLRRTAQYDLMIASVYSAQGFIAVLYGAEANGHAILKGSTCVKSAYWTNQCTFNRWTVDPGVNVFHPAVASTTVGGVGFKTILQATWMQQGTGSQSGQVAVYSAELYSKSGLVTGRIETGFQTPCPRMPQDGWPSSYWGDYDTKLGVYQTSNQNSPTFWRSFTDSTQQDGSSGACTSWTYNSFPSNVSATWINYP